MASEQRERQAQDATMSSPHRRRNCSACAARSSSYWSAATAQDETDLAAFDGTCVDGFIPDYIDFSYTSQSNAEIFTDFLDAFIEEGSAEVEKLENEVGEWEKNVASEPLFAKVSRTLHTIKGIAKGVGLQRLGTLVHNFETLLDKMPRPDAGEEQGYFRIVNAWLDAVVRGVEYVTDKRADVASELPVAGRRQCRSSEQAGPEQQMSRRQAAVAEAASDSSRQHCTRRAANQPWFQRWRKSATSNWRTRAPRYWRRSSRCVSPPRSWITC